MRRVRKQSERAPKGPPKPRSFRLSYPERDRFAAKTRAWAVQAEHVAARARALADDVGALRDQLGAPPPPDPETMTLALQGLDMRTLREVGAGVGLRRMPARKSDLIAAIVGQARASWQLAHGVAPQLRELLELDARALRERAKAAGVRVSRKSREETARRILDAELRREKAGAPRPDPFTTPPVRRCDVPPLGLSSAEREHYADVAALHQAVTSACEDDAVSLDDQCDSLHGAIDGLGNWFEGTPEDALQLLGMQPGDIRRILDRCARRRGDQGNPDDEAAPF
jgi:hypothetical protein